MNVQRLLIINYLYMVKLLSSILTTPGFIPHGHCYLWKPSLVGLQVGSDSLIVLAYYTIPISLFYFVRQRPDIPYPWIFRLFGAFIISCGTTHLLEIWTLWYPDYWVEGAIKAITALVSLATAIALVPLLPQALALRSPTELEAANRKLELEIAERKRVEAVQRETEAKLRLFVEHAPAAIAMFDRQMRYLAASKRWLSDFNLPNENIIGRSHYLVFPHLPERWKAVHRRCLAGAIEKSEEDVFERADGTKDWSRWEARPWYSSMGEIGGIIIFSEPIAQRKQFEAVLRESNERFRLAFKNAPIGMAVVSPEGKFLQVNRALCEIVGYSAAELEGTTFQEITYSEDLEADLSYMHRMLAGEIRTYQMEKRYLHKDGHLVWVLLNGSLVRDAESKPLYFIAQIQDITESKQHQQTLEASLREKEVLLKEIHHRVKNNLQVICSLLRLQSRSIEDPQVKALFAESQNRVKSMALVHEQLYQSPNFYRLNLAKYLRNLGGNLLRSYAVNNQNVTINTEVIDTFFLDMDSAVPLGLIINELISNALKYAFAPEISGKILIAATTDAKDNLVLTVRDNGKGLPEDYDLKRSQSLGLALVQDLVSQLRGTLEVTEDSGTKFMMILTKIKANK